VSVRDAFLGTLAVEVEPGEVAGVGVVAKADVDRAGTVVDGGFQGRQAAGGADEVDVALPGVAARSGSARGIREL
jgi:hypothetical protein